jgi:predicted nucleic acid-binding Zn ribbon protein
MTDLATARIRRDTSLVDVLQLIALLWMGILAVIAIWVAITTRGRK